MLSYCIEYFNKLDFVLEREPQCFVQLGRCVCVCCCGLTVINDTDCHAQHDASYNMTDYKNRYNNNNSDSHWKDKKS